MSTALALLLSAWVWDGGDAAPSYLNKGLHVQEASAPPVDAPGVVAPHDPITEKLVPDPSLPPPAPPSIRLRVMGGGTAGLMTGGETKIEPAARIAAGWDVYRGKRPVTAHVIGDLSALPGDALDLTDPTSFRALEFTLALSWRALPEVAASAYASASFASRLETRGNEPVMEAPKTASFGVLFGTEERHAHLGVGVGPTQALDGKWVAAIEVQGAIDLYAAETGRLEGTSIAMLVKARLGLEHSNTTPTRRDIVTVSVMAAWGQ